MTRSSQSMPSSTIGQPRGSLSYRAAAIAAVLLSLQLGCKGRDQSATDNRQLQLGVMDLKPAGKASCERPLIDNFEDGDTQVELFDGRGGYWYTFKDKNGTTLLPDPLAPASGGPGDSKQAIHISGRTGQHVETFAGMGLQFSESQLPYDLSAASGICFRAKGVGVARVQLPDVDTFPEGGRCKKCYNSFGRDFEVTSDWQDLCFSFNELSQKRGWGEPAPALVAERVFGVQWQVSRHDMDYDIWIDDIRLSCDSAAPAAVR